MQIERVNQPSSAFSQPGFTPGVSASSTNRKIAVYTPISDQIKKATQKSNRRSMIAGCLLGAFVPSAVYLISHSEPIREAGGIFGALTQFPYLVFLILGGLIFSATSVVRWGYQAFGQSWIKAIGFVVLVEGTLILSPIQWLSLAALVYLVAINALVTGTTLALDRKRQFQIRREKTTGNLTRIEVIKAKPTKVPETAAPPVLLESTRALPPAPPKRTAPRRTTRVARTPTPSAPSKAPTISPGE